jgi:hypothetical protein
MLAPLGLGGTGCACRNDKSLYFALVYAVAYVKYNEDTALLKITES